MHIIIVPGLGGSGHGHWQSLWERRYPRTVRVEQHDWDRPDRSQWLARFAEVARPRPGAIVVAHSLGCALVAHLSQQRPDIVIGGALLVAPADVDADNASPELSEFAPMPRGRLPFRTIVVASTDDPYLPIERAQALADGWGASFFINVGACGHINVASGFGDWPVGESLLHMLMHAYAEHAGTRQHVLEETL